MEEKATNADRRATLGCGTLILIALIVLIFGNTGNDELRDEIRKMRTELNSLQTSIREQSDEISKLREAME